MAIVLVNFPPNHFFKTEFLSSVLQTWRHLLQLFHCFAPAKLQDLRQFEFGSNFACYPPFPPRNILFAGFRSSAGKSSGQNIEFMTKIHLEDPFLALDLKLRRVRGGGGVHVQ